MAEPKVLKMDQIFSLLARMAFSSMPVWRSTRHSCVRWTFQRLCSGCQFLSARSMSVSTFARLAPRGDRILYSTMPVLTDRTYSECTSCSMAVSICSAPGAPWYLRTLRRQCKIHCCFSGSTWSSGSVSTASSKLSSSLWASAGAGRGDATAAPPPPPPRREGLAAAPTSLLMAPWTVGSHWSAL